MGRASSKNASFDIHTTSGGGSGVGEHDHLDAGAGNKHSPYGSSVSNRRRRDQGEEAGKDIDDIISNSDGNGDGTMPNVHSEGVLARCFLSSVDDADTAVATTTPGVQGLRDTASFSTSQLNQSSSVLLPLLPTPVPRPPATGPGRGRRLHRHGLLRPRRRRGHALGRALRRAARLVHACAERAGLGDEQQQQQRRR
eukprot:PhM_4_TR17422/c2_g1_i3/m.78014